MIIWEAHVIGVARTCACVQRVSLSDRILRERAGAMITLPQAYMGSLGDKFFEENIDQIWCFGLKTKETSFGWRGGASLVPPSPHPLPQRQFRLYNKVCILLYVGDVLASSQLALARSTKVFTIGTVFHYAYVGSDGNREDVWRSLVSTYSEPFM